MDRGDWRATVHGVAKSQTWLKRLSWHRVLALGCSHWCPDEDSYSCCHFPHAVLCPYSQIRDFCPIQSCSRACSVPCWLAETCGFLFPLMLRLGLVPKLTLQSHTGLEIPERKTLVAASPNHINCIFIIVMNKDGKPDVLLTWIMVYLEIPQLFCEIQDSCQ